MDLPAFSAFNKDDPQAFYLGSPSGAEFAGLSDATIVAAGLARRPSLESTFESYSLRSVCTLLRFLYWPEEAGTSTFSQLEPSTTLPELARLAHMLDAPSLLGKLDRHLAVSLTSSSVEAAVSWTQLAEQCHLRKLHLQCIHKLAHKLAAKGQRLSRESLMAVLAACVAAAQGQQDLVPSDDDLDAAGAV
ncbi:hypothetical protein ABPG77_001761 [Micractinium sp. CCAP 211/92]